MPPPPPPVPWRRHHAHSPSRLPLLLALSLLSRRSTAHRLRGGARRAAPPWRRIHASVGRGCPSPSPVLLLLHPLAVATPCHCRTLSSGVSRRSFAHRSKRRAEPSGFCCRHRVVAMSTGSSMHGLWILLKRGGADKRSLNESGLCRVLEVVCEPATVKIYRKFEAEIYVLTKDEGGRHTAFFSNYSPQFYFRTADICGKIELPPDVKMVMPGDNITAIFELTFPVPLEPGLKFALREGGRTVGFRVITEVMC